MRKTLMILVAFLVGAFSLVYAEGRPTGASPRALPSVAASPSASPGGACNCPCAQASPKPSASGGVAGVLSPAQAKSLRGEFVKAQALELKALRHRQKAELAQLRAAQTARMKDWQAKEKNARHEFMKTHQGAELRNYIRDFIDRRKALLKGMADDRARRSQEQDVRLKAAAADQATKLKEFGDYLQKGQRPPSKYWPDGHGF